MVGQVPEEIATYLDWPLAGTEPVTGYGPEDAEYLRVFFDDNFCMRNKGPGDANPVAGAFVRADNPQGNFVVIKQNITTGEWIPFPKSELVDLVCWRRWISNGGFVSSRMYRENMRRRELQAYFHPSFGTYQEVQL